MKQKLLLLFLGLFFVVVQVMAQQKTITGKVTSSEDGLPIPGASVKIKGSNTGVQAGTNGTYSISAKAGDVLQFIFLGTTTQERTVGSADVIDITLTSNSQALGEVVVTALGIKKEKRALGYSVSDLSADELMKNKNTNVVNSLAGKVPGVNVTQFGGSAGAGASITIRGGNSTSDGRPNQPLFVVDGIIYDNSTSSTGNTGTDGLSRSNTTYSNRVMDINPEDIENLSVLKGAAAAALYGSRAADGVIIITTKRGSEGSTSVDYTTRLSTSWANKLPEVQTEFGVGSYAANGVFDNLNYRHWDTWEDGKFDHVMLVSTSNPADKKDLMPNEPYDCPTKPFGGDEDFVWSTDGKQVVYVTKKKYGTAYATSTNSDLYSYDIASGKTINLTDDNKGYDISPAFNSKNELAWLSMSREGYEADKQDLVVWNGRTKMNLTKQRDDIHVEGFQWSEDGKSLYFTAPVNGTLQLFNVNYPGLTKMAVNIRQVTKGDFDIASIVGQKGNMLIVSRTDMNHAAELYKVNTEDGSMTQLTHVNDGMNTALKQSRTERRMIRTTDGKDMLVWV
ncbi:MAG: hypothetical protein EOO92_19460, partial [Pedobacter sp.]